MISALPPSEKKRQFTIGKQTVELWQKGENIYIGVPGKKEEEEMFSAIVKVTYPPDSDLIIEKKGNGTPSYHVPDVHAREQAFQAIVKQCEHAQSNFTTEAKL